ncbi:MAG: hypothetical protein ACYTA3_08810 [Planctomycetota bacterium]
MEDRAPLEVERALLAVVDADANDVRRQQVGRALDAGERAVEGLSSIRTCPRASTQTITRSTAAVLPM